jgi:hypothetical protein
MSSREIDTMLGIITPIITTIVLAIAWFCKKD